ncbi:helix-turn-helix domain-containing protein [Micromonospora sp. NPDC003816]|uniref:nSTAND1 domain-containing NTPase n=1 Tax=Micromonospora sp. NPDC003816 TaxID=3364224 RepID=UPI0036C5F9E3
MSREDDERTGLPGIRDREDFARELTVLRERSGQTVRQVAARVGVPWTTIGGWFSGQGLPSLALRDVLVDVLRACGVADPEQVQAWLRTWERIRQAPGRRSSLVVPYRGLAAFGVEEADWFFGRGPMTSELLQRVREVDVRGGGTLVVVGASGAGKSSLLRAGLLAEVRKGSEKRPAVVMTPGSRPVLELSRHLTAGGGSPASGPPGLMLVVDQFEEVFTACAEERERVEFLRHLAELSQRNGHTVVVGLRADFYAAALRHPYLTDALRDNQFMVGAMTAEEMREAIVRPAERAGLAVDEGLVDLILRDVAPAHGSERSEADPSVLPLLSHALYATWQQGRRRRLRTADYRAAGEISGAVASSADTIYGGLNPVQRVVARRVFLQLVHVAPDVVDVRRRIAPAELVDHLDPVEAQAAREVVDRFVAQRLVSVDATTVQISHEALLTSWPKLREWVDADRAALIVGRRLDTAVAQWRAAGQDEDHLYRGGQLASAVEWLREHQRQAAPTTTAFVAASLRHERRRARRLYLAVAVLTVLLMGAVSGGALALIERNRSEQLRSAAVVQRDQALSRLVASRADQLRDKDLSLAAQLAVAAFRIWPTPEARASMIGATGNSLPARLSSAGDRQMQAVSWHPDGTVLTAASGPGLRSWNLSRQPRPERLGPFGEQTAPWRSVTYSPNGRYLAAAAEDGVVRLWDSTDPRRPMPIAVPEGTFDGKSTMLAVNSDGSVLATASGDGRLSLWDLRDPRRPTRIGATIRSGVAPITALALTPDAQTVIAGGETGAVEVWRLSAPRRTPTRALAAGAQGQVHHLAVSPDGTKMAVASRDYHVHLWDLSDPTRPRKMGPPLSGADSWVNAVQFSPDGTLLAAGSSDTAVGLRLWEVTSRKIVGSYPHPAPVTGVAFAPDGRTIATATNDGAARIWPVTGPTMIAPGVVSSATFSPNGRILAVGSTETQLWNVTDRTAPVPYGLPLPSPDGFAGTFAFSPDSHTMAVSHGGSGTYQLWNVSNPSRPAPHGEPVDAHDAQIESVAFHPGGTLLASGSDDGTVRLWDTSQPAKPVLIATLEGFAGYVTWVTFSPDGRTLAASSADHTFRIWDVGMPRNPRLRGQAVQVSNHYVYSVAFSPDGQTLATSSADSTVRLWRVESDGPARPMGEPITGPTNYVYLLSFSPDGRTLAAAGTDSSVWLWDLTDLNRPEQMAKITTPTGAVYSVDFHPDGRTLAAGGITQQTWIYDTDPDAAAQRICNTTGDLVSQEEWSRLVGDHPYRNPCD